METRHQFVPGKVTGMCYCNRCSGSRHIQQEDRRVVRLAVILLKDEKKVDKEFANMLSEMEQRQAKIEKKQAKGKAKKARNRANKAKRFEETKKANKEQRLRQAGGDTSGLGAFGLAWAKVYGGVPVHLKDGSLGTEVGTKKGAKNRTKKVRIKK